ncbi:uncharacterized protein LOC143898706 [Temnothorax americanus]|uniref:uncharacterized protein LOC143898706 n=1 Tax=Temnothorax americanus TaxID=1964332 RepID=UPI004067C99E
MAGISERNNYFMGIFIVAHVFNYCINASTLINSVFITFLWYIGTRFDEVKKHMQNLLVREKKEHSLRNTWKKPTIIVHQRTLGTDNYKRVLWSSIHLHSELCRIAREWNLVFGIQMTIDTASFSLLGTSLCFYLYKSLMHRELIPVSVWFRVAFRMFMIVGKVYTINYICENVCVKANKIDEIINKLTLRYADVLKEIYQFNLQTMHHPLEFTGMGFFPFVLRSDYNVFDHRDTNVNGLIYPLKNNPPCTLY